MSYIADSKGVLSNNLPQALMHMGSSLVVAASDTPEVAEAQRAHFAVMVETKARNAVVDSWS